MFSYATYIFIYLYVYWITTSDFLKNYYLLIVTALGLNCSEPSLSLVVCIGCFFCDSFCGRAWPLVHVDSVVAAPGFSGPAVCGIFTEQGSNMCPCIAG